MLHNDEKSLSFLHDTPEDRQRRREFLLGLFPRAWETAMRRAHATALRIARSRYGFSY